MKRLTNLFVLASMVLTGSLLTGELAAQTVSVSSGTPVLFAKRATVAIRYLDNKGTSVDMSGTAVYPKARGKAEVKRNDGRTRIKLKLDQLENPQALGPYYTTYVVWAIAPEGQADNLGELQLNKTGEADIEVTTSHQTFGLIVTAEPHGMVKLPSPIIVAENILRKDTKGGIDSSQIDYRGDTGSLYAVAAPGSRSMEADYNTPLTVLGARRAVEIARRAQADQFADSELHIAEVKLEALEQAWPQQRRDPEKFSGLAHDVMRLAEHARAMSTERIEQARLNSERREARSTIAQAQSEAALAQTEAERAKQQAMSYREALTRSEGELNAARQRVEQAQSEADKAKANEEVARLQAERARIESEQAKQERDAAQQRLYVSLAAILETRREARGLIVNLSDVLFDTGKATLKPGAREKLSKLAGVMLAYPGTYNLEIEGHTDSVGGDDFNQKLSEARAQTVRDYLSQAGLSNDHISAVRGFGKAQPVATNDTPEGRQMNRRVEIVISDTQLPAASVNR